MSLWPALPIELKRLILELVARDDPHNARSLRLVSRDINILVLPIIFHNVLIESVTDLLTVTRTISPLPTPVHRFKNKSTHPPRLLSTYNTCSLALLLPETRPSFEDALARVGAVFSRINYLAITSRNLSSNAFWLRANRVRPTHIMLLHHGSPRPVNWRDRLFSKTTHLYTSSLDSHGSSTLSDLKNLTHLAVSTHAELGEDKIRCIVDKLEWLLLDPLNLPTLQQFVLGIERFPLPPPLPPNPSPDDECVCVNFFSVFDSPSARGRYTNLLNRWRSNLYRCLLLDKFYILPDPLYPRDEWDTWIYGDGDGDGGGRRRDALRSNTIWSRAEKYRDQYPNAMVFDPRPPQIIHHHRHHLHHFPNHHSHHHHHHQSIHHLPDHWLSMIAFNDNIDTSEDIDVAAVLDAAIDAHPPSSSSPASPSPSPSSPSSPSPSASHSSSPSPSPSQPPSTSSSPSSTPSSSTKPPTSSHLSSSSLCKIDWEIDLIQREGYRESERLDPGEEGEFVHIMGF